MRLMPQERNKMIHPSYVDLMNVVNKEVEEATAKRARQIIAGDEPMVKVKDKQKPLSIAVDEMNQGQLRILTDEEKEALLTENQEETPAEETAENE